MADFNPNSEAQSIVKIAEAYNLALIRHGGSEVARGLMSEVQDEWCKMSRQHPAAVQPTIDAIEQTPVYKGGYSGNSVWKSVTDGDGHVLGIARTNDSKSSDLIGVEAYLPLKCRM